MYLRRRAQTPPQRRRRRNYRRKATRLRSRYQRKNRTFIVGRDSASSKKTDERTFAHRSASNVYLIATEEASKEKRGRRKKKRVAVTAKFTQSINNTPTGCGLKSWVTVGQKKITADDKRLETQDYLPSSSPPRSKSNERWRGL